MESIRDSLAEELVKMTGQVSCFSYHFHIKVKSSVSIRYHSHLDVFQSLILPFHKSSV